MMWEFLGLGLCILGILAIGFTVGRKQPWQGLLWLVAVCIIVLAAWAGFHGAKLI